MVRPAESASLNQLVPVAQDRDPQQRARRIVVTEVPPHHLPGGKQILTALTGDVDPSS